MQRHARMLMQKTLTPVRLWCFCYKYVADILSPCATERFNLRGRTPYEVVTNYTPDISEYVSFSWFQWCWCLDEDRKCKSLCRWIGPAHHIGQSMCWYVLHDNAEYLARSSVIAGDELSKEAIEIREQMSKFTRKLESRIGNNLIPTFDGTDPGNIYFTSFGTTVEEEMEDLPYGDDFTTLRMENVDDRYLADLDNLIGVQVSLPGKDGIPLLATVKKRKLGYKGHPIGSPNTNLILDSRIYELELPDGRVEEYSVNIIIENMLDQVANNDWDASMFDEVISVRKGYNTINKGPGAYVKVNGIKRTIITTKG